MGLGKGKRDGARHRVRSESGRVGWEAKKRKKKKEKKTTKSGRSTTKSRPITAAVGRYVTNMDGPG